METKKIRDNSIETAKQFGVAVLPTLPLLDIGLEMRSADEIASRIMVMNVVAAIAYGFDKKRAIAWLNQENLAGLLSEGEKQFVYEGVGQPERFKVQIEGMWALAWAIGVVAKLDFTKDCDNGFVLLLPNLKQNQSSREFRNKIHLRSTEQILHACDLAYCLHWAIRDSNLRGKQAPIIFKPYRIIERRRALDWISVGKQWNETPMDT